MSDYPGAIDMFVDESRVFINDNTHQYLVIHKTAGFKTVRQLGNYFSTTSEVTSSHFGVGLKGEVAQFVLLKDGAAANCCGVNASRYGGGNLNTSTISIEHIDPSTDNSTDPPQAQIDASFALVRWLCDKYGITPDRIIRHADIDPVNRSLCPNNYPMDALRRFISMPEVNTFNQMVVDIWNSTNLLFGLAGVPKRDTGIFNAWRQELLEGRFRGIPLTAEYHSVDAKGIGVVTQQFSMGMCQWYDKDGAAWSDIK